ncbi:hypothetical protein [Aquabacter cavernae]|uniref:hypothetical protein n=1 Tax=Aquabacter cavernae TaxID=2496029 RepID=UPI000F8F3623|nr:hypothetical protein [Aquabacter cavernae]
MRKTISDTYLQLQTELHKIPQYGTASLGYGKKVKELLEQINGTSLSDYGAGKCRLLEALKNVGVENIEYYPYDPVFPEYGPPRSADLVCCIDVLEHIEEEYIDDVINDLKKITTNYGLFSIATGPARKKLSDGRNAHLIQKKTSWWLPKFLPHFDILELTTTDHGFWFTVRPAEPAQAPSL